jgi:hypothetical protein
MAELALLDEIAALQFDNRRLKEIARLKKIIATLETGTMLVDMEIPLVAEIAAGIKGGKSPRTLARTFAMAYANVVHCLQMAVGRELISRSEILFTIEELPRRIVEGIASEDGVRTSGELSLRVRGVDKEVRPEDRDFYNSSIKDDVLLYFKLREAPRADMYESLSRLESFMHAYIKTELQRGYGPDSWWRKGIPESVRRDCVLAKEADSEPQDDPYCYTTFIHLRDILDKRWGIFGKLLPHSLVADKARFLSELVRLNAIRNRIMHPARAYMPAKCDFDFVQDFAARMFAEAPNWPRDESQ